MADADRSETTELERWGRRAWAFVGLTLAAVAAYLGSSLISSLVVPLLVALVVGALFAPACGWLARWMPRAVAAGIVSFGLVAVGIGIVVVAVRGMVSQAGEIGRWLADGIDALLAWLEVIGIETPSSGAVIDGLLPSGSSLLSGFPAQVGSLFSGTAAFLAGLFIGIFMLYFILADWDTLTRWTSRHLGVREDIGSGILDDSVWSMRKYFLALTFASAVVALIVATAAWLLGLPLAVTIGLVTFITAYVPYLGAIFSGAFAVLIGLGAGGTEAAVLMLIVILIAQNAVQPVIQTLLTSGALKLHPIVVLGSTIVGGALFGLLGAALSTPVVAIVVKIVERLRAEREHADGADTQAPMAQDDRPER